jgi:Tfp pilus assembly protein PilX
MSWTHRIRNERGIALMTVLFVGLVVAVLTSTAVLLTMTSSMVNRNTDRQLVLEAVADAGVEVGRSRVNGNPAVYPASGYTTLEQDASVTDASGATIPNVTRSVYVGPTGITSGQYGVFGSVVSIARDSYGNTVVRRGEVVQESFAKYAYFTDIEPSNISFGGGDQIFGPVHTNDYLKIYSSGATFFGPVTTAKTVQGAQYGTFAQGYTEHARRIEMPQVADLVKLKAQAQAGNTAFVGNNNGASGQATTRIEFVAIDLNGDGQVNGTNEGFIRVYQSSDAGWVTADEPSDYSTNRLRNSLNCGHFHGDTLVAAKAHPNSGSDSYTNALTGSGRRCLLGGADAFWGGFKATDTKGQWLTWPGGVSGLLAGRPDAQYLFPITRELNPNFKGVIYVDGKVVVSGVLRGRVTVAASNEIIIGDDLTYATDPGAGTCNDIMGLFSGTDVIVADNTINSPQRAVTSSNTYYTFDETRDEFIQGVVLALSNFTVENYDAGATTAEACEAAAWGRGCLYLTGGIIQSTRGAVGTIGSTGGTGYVKRYSYDACAFTDPPPYFPTTGVFARGRYFEVDPVGFNVAQYYQMLTPPSN